jgi:hypothetical protein
MEWVRYNGYQDFIWHVANERAINPYSGSILKRKGVMAGVSDLSIMRASKGYHGAFIEMKSPKGKVTESQKKFLDSMSKEGYFTAVCYSCDEAMAVIKDYLLPM